MTEDEAKRISEHMHNLDKIHHEAILYISGGVNSDRIRKRLEKANAIDIEGFEEFRAQAAREKDMLIWYLKALHGYVYSAEDERRYFDQMKQQFVISRANDEAKYNQIIAKLNAEIAELRGKS